MMTQTFTEYIRAIKHDIEIKLRWFKIMWILDVLHYIRTFTRILTMATYLLMSKEK